MRLTVSRAGFATSVQDYGRFGFRQHGVSVGGGLDRHALRIINFLAGNQENAAGLEITSGNVQLQFQDQRLLAWAGGDYEVIANGRTIPPGHCFLVRESEILSFSGPRSGCRAWLAVSGGIEVQPVLGSRATDTRAKFGGYEGRVLRDGDVLPLGENSAGAKAWMKKLRDARVAPWSAPYAWVHPAEDQTFLRTIPGADWDRFDDPSRRAFTSSKFTVSSASDRMGARLEGADLKRKEDGDLVSEAVAPGTVQVPPSGNPILLLGDCQTIGGYPKIAHVITVDLPQAAQLCPGAVLRFSIVTLADAYRLLFERESEVERFGTGVRLQQS